MLSQRLQKSFIRRSRRLIRNSTTWAPEPDIFHNRKQRVGARPKINERNSCWGKLGRIFMSRKPKLTSKCFVSRCKLLTLSSNWLRQRQTWPKVSHPFAGLFDIPRKWWFIKWGLGGVSCNLFFHFVFRLQVATFVALCCNVWKQQATHSSWVIQT